MKLHHLVQLNAKIDQINFQYPYDEEEQGGGPGLGTLAAGAGAAGLVGGGLYARGRAATPYGPLPQGQGRGMFSTMKRGAGALMGDADSAYKGAASGLNRAGAYAGGVGAALKDTVGTYTAHRTHMGAGVGKAVAGAGRAVLDRLKNLRYSANHSRLVQLNSNIDEIIGFADMTGQPNRKGQRPEDNLRRGIGMGLFGGSVVPFAGALAGGLEADAYTKAGAVLRKRDVLGHELVGAVGGTVGGALGSIGTSRFGPRANAAGTILGALGGYAASRAAISKSTLDKRRAELRNGIMM